MTIAHLTKAIVLKDDFTEARLLRAEALYKMQQFAEAMEDIEAILAQNPDEEAALLLRGKIKEATGKEEESRDGLSPCDRDKPLQRTSLPISGTTIYHTEEIDSCY